MITSVKNDSITFFPFAFSSVRKDEICRVNASPCAYKDLDAEVFGISVDNPYSLEKMAFLEELKFPLLSNLIRAYLLITMYFALTYLVSTEYPNALH